MPQSYPFTLKLSAFWVVYCAWALLSGWVLSYFKKLDAEGYLTMLPLLLIGVLCVNRIPAKRPQLILQGWTSSPLMTRAPRTAWLFVILIIGIGACLHAPSNYDGLTYRLPRLLHWLQHHGWFWIGGIDYRMDIAGTGVEWMSAPLIVLFGNDRCLFLLNYLPFLFFPTWFFLAARGMGVCRKSAAVWMFLMPLAFGLVVQSGSIGNDLPGVALGLASVAFAARATRSHPLISMVLSAFCVAMMSAIKITMMPLLLPIGLFWLVQAWKCCRRPASVIAFSACLPLFAICSFLPHAVLCWQHCGAWNGNPENRYGTEIEHPLAGIVGNTLAFTTSIFAPPILPNANAIDARAHALLSSKSWYQWLQNHYSSFDFGFRQELPSEESSGIGLGVTFAMFVWTLLSRIRREPLANVVLPRWLILGSVGFATLVFLAKGGAGASIARLMLPFTPFFLFALLPYLGNPPGHQRRIWLASSLLPGFFLLPTLLINPNRPLLAPRWLSQLPGVPSSLSARMESVFETYARRNALLDPLLSKLPPTAVIGYAGEIDHPHSSLFFPIGQRRVYDFQAATESRCEWIIGTREGIEVRSGKSFDSWSAGNYRLVYQENLTAKVSVGPELWYIFRKTNTPER